LNSLNTIKRPLSNDRYKQLSSNIIRPLSGFRTPSGVGKNSKHAKSDQRGSNLKLSSHYSSKSPVNSRPNTAFALTSKNFKRPISALDEF
jgi:hypothetical protein